MNWDHEFQDLVAQVEEIQARIAAEQPQPLPELVVPSVLEFVLSNAYLNKAVLFPRQATLLKTLFLEVGTLTDYDLDVLREWRSGFQLGQFDDLLDGRWFEPVPDREFVQGTTPDIVDRMVLMRSRGRRSFKHLNLVAGRRAGKGEVAAMAVTYLLWQLLALGEPQPHVNAARGKVLSVDCFAGNEEQARSTVFADIARAIVGSACFAPFIVKLTRDRLVLATPFDRASGRGLGYGTIEIVARETTVLSGRGQSAVCQIFDEMAYVDAANSKAPADELYAAATPALDQARGWGMVLTLSSPHNRMGQFYDLHRQACEVDVLTGETIYPEMATFQFPSWALYLDVERATALPMTTPARAATDPWFADDTGAPRTFPPPGGAPIVDDDELRQKRKADPVRYMVETCGQWANASDPFLEDRWVTGIFARLDGEDLVEQDQGVLSHDYVLHIDPSSKHDPTVYMIAHAVKIDGVEFPVADLIRRFVPVDGEDLDWEIIYDQLEADIRAFQPWLITVDQFGSTFVLTEVRRRIKTMQLRTRTTVKEFTHTRSMNTTIASELRNATMRGVVRCYPHRQLQLELQFLQEHHGTAKAPTTGPVTTDDAAVCLMVVVHHLLRGDAGIHEALGGLRPSGQPGTPNPVGEAFTASTRAANQRNRQGYNPARGRPGRRL